MCIILSLMFEVRNKKNIESFCNYLERILKNLLTNDAHVLLEIYRFSEKQYEII